MHNSLPLVLRLERAKTEIKQNLKQVSALYELPDFLLLTAAESVLAEQRARLISDLAGQISVGEVLEEGNADGENNELSE